MDEKTKTILLTHARSEIQSIAQRKAAFLAEFELNANKALFWSEALFDAIGGEHLYKNLVSALEHNTLDLEAYKQELLEQIGRFGGSCSTSKTANLLADSNHRATVKLYYFIERVLKTDRVAPAPGEQPWAMSAASQRPGACHGVVRPLGLGFYQHCVRPLGHDGACRIEV